RGRDRRPDPDARRARARLPGDRLRVSRALDPGPRPAALSAGMVSPGRPRVRRRLVLRGLRRHPPLAAAARLPAAQPRRLPRLRPASGRLQLLRDASPRAAGRAPADGRVALLWTTAAARQPAAVDGDLRALQPRSPDLLSYRRIGLAVESAHSRQSPTSSRPTITALSS